MGKSKSSDSSGEIASILQRLKRSTDETTSVAQPPNQAQRLMGRRLGTCFLEVNLNDGQEIVQVLCLPTTNPSVPQAFFKSLQTPATNENIQIRDAWISAWIQLAQDAEQPNTLQAILAYYAWHCRQQAGKMDDLDGDRITNTYFLLTAESRPQFVSLFAHQASPYLTRQLLSPILAASVLTIATPLAERTMVLDSIIRSCWSASEEGIPLDTVSWHIEGLTMLLDCSGSSDDLLALPWLTQIMDMLEAVTDGGDLTGVLSAVIGHILPRFFQIVPQSLQPILSTALQLVEKQDATGIDLDDETLFKLMSMALSTPLEEDSHGLLQLLEKLSSINNCSPWSARLRTIMASIFAQDPTVAAISSKLMKSVDMKEGKESGIFLIIGIDAHDLDSFLELATHAVKKVNSLPVLTQNALLLLSCGVLVERDECNAAKIFVKTLLQEFPHLGISMVPVLLHSVQDTSDGRVFLSRLQFLCDSVVHDPHCAQEVWSLVGVTLSKREQPLFIRLAAIRMFSTLCANNRRLYRRVVDSLGSFVDERQAEIRLAIITVVCDLGEQDLIRDVSDVIGWVQTFLGDEIPAIAHLAVMSLHYMVANGELDFNLVIKVLGKRLCAVGDVGQVLQLHELVIEALVVLLGDGEAETEDSDDNGGLSPQVSSAVQTLLELADNSFFAEVEPDAAMRIKLNILRSLAGYSKEALGIDEDGIKTATATKLQDSELPIPEEAQRYVALCNLVEANIINPPMGNDGLSPVDILVQKLIKEEEDILGAAIWQKGHKSLSNSKKVQKTAASKAALAALPKPQTIYDLYDADPGASTAIASLLCFNGEDFGRLADYAGDLSNEILSPTLRILNFQGWLHAMSRVWSHVASKSSGSLVDHLEKVVDEVRGWRDTVVDADYVYLALISLSLYVPRSFSSSNGSNVDLGSIVDSIMSDVESAFSDHQFADLDVGHLCLAFAGVRSLHGGANDGFVRIQETLRKAFDEGAGSIGLFYGMAFMAQCIPTGATGARSMIIADRRQRQIWVGETVGLLVNELQLCFEEGSPAIIILVASLKSASMQPGLISNLKDLHMLAIQSSLVSKTKSLFMSLGACVQSLVGINPDLVQGLFQLLLKIPYGSGVEYVLASMVSNKTIANILTKRSLVTLRENLLEITDQGPSLFLSASLRSEANEDAQWLEQNIGLLNSSDLILSWIPVLGTLPMLAVNEMSSIASSRLLPNATPKAIALILDVLHTSGSEVAIPLQGLLSSMSLPQVPASTFLSSTSTASTSQALQFSLDASRLPTPNDTTLLYQLVSSIRSEVNQARTDDDASSSLLPRLLWALSPLSLPGQFATDLLGPLLLESGSTKIKVAALQLLLSQFTGRRKAAIEGKDFVNLAARVMSLQETTIFFNEGDIFYSGMADLIRKSSTDLADSIISQSWQNCLFNLTEHGETAGACKWLAAFKPILFDIGSTNSLSLSPRTSSIIRLFIVKDVFSSLVAVSTNREVEVIFDGFAECMLQIPFAVLDERSFFLFDTKRGSMDQLWKVRCIAALINASYFDEGQRLRKVVTSLFAWFSRQQLQDATRVTMCKVGFAITSAVTEIDDITKNQVVLLLLESMLVHGHDVIALELLGLLANQWGSSGTSIASLTLRGTETLPKLSAGSVAKVWRSIVENMPAKLGSFARRTKTERIISNRIVQVHNSWAEDGVTTKTTLALLIKMLNSCKGRYSTEKDSIAIMASKLSIAADSR